MAIAKIKILAKEEKYEELYDFFSSNFSVFADNLATHSFIDSFCRVKMGLIDSKNIPRGSYRLNQMLNYHESEFLKHVKRHMAFYNRNSKLPNSSIFNIDFPFEMIYQEIKKYIPSDKKLILGFFDSTYFFKYNNCGTVNKIPTDYFLVKCFNSNDYITMCPIINGESLPYVDLNYLKSEQIKKSKTISQIDKFNRRYNR